ncbi:MAG TPA: ATP-binding protein [archaeon]|nr:ATP-binding protein [archaeon]
MFPDASLRAVERDMTTYLAAYGKISQQVSEAIDYVSMIRAKVRGKCFGPNRALQDEVRKIYGREVEERLRLIGRLIIELGESRPQRFASALSRLSLNLGEKAEQMVDLLYIPGYHDLQKVVVAQLDHIRRSLIYFQKTVTNKEEPTTVNINYLFRDITLAVCPYRSGFLPASDERMVGVSFKEKLDDEVPHMLGEDESLYLAFYQIMANAVTAAGDQGTVSVYTKYYSRFNQIQATIADNGQGIDRLGVLKSALETETINPIDAEEIRDDKADLNNKVFDLIYKPRVSAFKNESSKGIGLALAHDEISRHRGKIDIFSKPSRGATFQVFFYIR